MVESSPKPQPRPLFNGMNYEQYMEYIADEIKDNPIAQLGVDPNIMSITARPQGPLSEDFKNYLGGLGSPTMNASYTYFDENEDSVEIGEDLKEGKPVQAHEFTHRGFRLLKNYYDEDPEFFVDKYGQAAANIVKDIGTREAHRRNEFDTEMYDNREAVFETSFGPMRYGEHTEGDTATIDKFQKYRSLLGPRVEKAQTNKLDRSLFDAFQQLERAAGDMMNKRKGYAQGGLAEQMDSMLPAADNDTRSTEEYLKDTKPMDISNVPFFERPMDASKNDKPTGNMDETGAIEYRTALGNTYFVRRNPDQRTTRTKIQEDVLPVVKDWIKNPQAPSVEQAVEMGKAISKSAWELLSIPGDLATGKKTASDVTMQDVYDMTGTMTLGSAPFKVPENALRTFGGKGARDLDVGAFAQARELMKDGVQRVNPNNPEQFYDLNKKVWKETGWYIDPKDNQWRFEIDDSKSKVTLDNLPITYKELEDSGGEFNLPDLFKHDEIYKQYPHLKNITVRFYNPKIAKNSTEMRDNVAGYMSNDGSGILAINTAGIDANTIITDEIRDTILHEIQHSIQRYEGFTPGSNENYIDPGVLTKGEQKVLDKIKDLSFDNSGIKINNAQLKVASLENWFPANLAKDYASSGYTTNEITKDLLDRRSNYVSELMKDYPNGIPPELGEKVLANIDKLKDNIFKQAQYELGLPKLATEFYRGAGGEIESRLVEFSKDMTDWQRKNDPPGGSKVFNEKSGNYEGLQGFPLDRENQLLEKERRLHATGFRGKEGVDPTQLARRSFNPEAVGSTDVYLDINRSDFRRPRDSSGKPEVDKKGKPKKPLITEKLNKIFKGEDKLLSIINSKPGSSFNLNGQNYTFNSVDTKLVNRNELEGDRGYFLLRPTPDLGSSVFVPVIEARNSLGNRVEISIANFVEDIGKYAGKNVDKQTTSIFGRIKNKLGLTPSTSERANPTLEDFGYYVDNPAKWGNTDWAKNKQASAEKYAKEGGKSAQKLLSGPQTAFLGIDNKKPLYLDTEFLSTLKGANDEVTDMSNPKYVGLKKSVEEEGFIPDQKGNKIIIGINHKGKAFIMEGNNRVAIAKEFGAPSVKAEVRYYNGAEEVDGPYSPQNILKYASQASRQFAEGGAVSSMNEQMSFAFADGGLRDDGVRQDPVSGNEVPSGSLANEVRDDIPAQLSEGEYVVPADVVRYYGVKFFEDLRQEAKTGLQDMEMNGRIGGEPVLESGPEGNEDLTPEELAAIQEMMGMYGGGAVGGFAEGGLQTDQDILTAGQQAQQRQFTGFPLGATIFPRADSGQIESVPVTPTITIQETAESCARKGMSYDPATQTCVAMPVQAPVQTVSDNNDGPPPVPTEPAKPWYESVDWTTTDIADPTATESILRQIPGVGQIVSMRNIAGQYAKANILEAAGDPTAAKQIRDNIEKYMGKQDLGTKIAKDAFGRYADGDWMTIQYLNSIGIETPKDLKTEDGGGMPEFIAGLAKDPTKRALIAGSISPERKKLIDQSVATEAEKARIAAEKAEEAKREEARRAQQQTTIQQIQQSNQSDSPTYGYDPDPELDNRRTTAPASANSTYKFSKESPGDTSTPGGAASSSYLKQEDANFGLLNKGGLMASKPKTQTKRQYKKGGLAGKK